MPRKSKSLRRTSTVRKSSSRKIFFEVWYESKPNIRNPKIKCENLKVGLDDDDEWVLTGSTNLSTLGTIKKVYGKQRLQLGY